MLAGMAPPPRWPDPRPEALATAAGLALDLGLRPVTIAEETAPPTTPPPRSPRTSSSPWRRPPSGWRRPPARSATCSCRWCARPSRTGRCSGGRALTGPIARGDGQTVARQRAAVSRACARPAGPVRRARRGNCRARGCARRQLPSTADRRRRAGPRAPCPGPTVRTVAELRAALAPARRAGRVDRARADDGRAARGPPLADSPGARGMRRGGGIAVRQSHPVRPASPTSSAIRATRCAISRSRRGRAPTWCSRRGPERGVPAGLLPPPWRSAG